MIARLSRFLAVAAGVCLLAVIAAATAAAQPEDLVQEATGLPCPSAAYVNHGGAPAGACRLHLISNASQIEFGTPNGMYICNMEAEGTIDGDGAGYLYDIAIVNCPVSITPCNEAGVEDNWQIAMTSETTLELAMCFVLSGMTIQCKLEDLTFTQGAGHSGTIITTGASHRPCDEAGGNTVLGTWNVENDAVHPELEVVDSTSQEVTREATGAHCPRVAYVNHGVAAGACKLHMAGTAVFANPFFTLNCPVELEGVMGEAGEGYLNGITISTCPPLLIAPCMEAGVADNWRLRFTSETTVDLQLCTTSGNPPIPTLCTIEGLTFTEADATHAGGTITTGATAKTCAQKAGWTVQTTLSIENDVDHPELEMVD